jgi:hypothetical protein
MAFRDFLFDKLSSRMWVVAPRMTTELREQGYDVAVSQRKFTALRAEYLSSQASQVSA